MILYLHFGRLFQKSDMSYVPYNNIYIFSSPEFRGIDLGGRLGHVLLNVKLKQLKSQKKL